MEGFKSFPPLIAAILVISVISVEGQISTPCTSSMVASFTPCINFITGSSSNGTSPTVGCCSAIKSLMSGSMDCACLLVTGNVPLSLPINSTLAISLPRACKSSVPLQCKASGVPLPAPGPALFVPPASPVLSPTADSPLSPRASKAAAMAPPPADQIAPASPPVNTVTPTANAGIRPVVIPTSSVSNPSSHISSPFIQLLFMGIMVFVYC